MMAGYQAPQNVLKSLIDNKLVVELPGQFQDLYNSIEESKYMLEFEENWDDEGSAPYDKFTWIRAVKFISDYTIKIYSADNKIIDAPKIYPGPDKSIDVWWKKEKYRLLINIPDDTEEPATYYGDDYGSQTMKGTFDPLSYNPGLLSCLLTLFQ